MTDKRPSIERMTEEGFLISLSAVRMAVKNRLIIGALRDHLDYDPARYAQAAKRQLTLLSKQSAQDARRVTRQRRELRVIGLSYELSGPRRRELKQLRHRRKVYEALATALLAAASDDEQVVRLVEQAQRDAAEEVRGALEVRLTEGTVERSADYELGREERIRDLLEVDLAALAGRDGDGPS